MTRQLTSDALGLSLGTLATLTSETAMAALEQIQTDFARFCDGQPDQARPWQEAWQHFWWQRTGTPMTLASLAATLDQAAQQTQATITRARLEAETRTKMQTLKPQAPPVGLFAQEQLSMY